MVKSKEGKTNYKELSQNEKIKRILDEAEIIFTTESKQRTEPSPYWELDENYKSLKEKITKLESNVETIRTDMFQTISIFVGLLGIIFTIIIAAAFQPNEIKLDHKNAVLFLICYIVSLNLVWYILWIIRNSKMFEGKMKENNGLENK